MPKSSEVKEESWAGSYWGNAGLKNLFSQIPSWYLSSGLTGELPFPSVPSTVTLHSMVWEDLFFNFHQHLGLEIQV